MHGRTLEPHWALHRVPGDEGDAPVVLDSDKEVGGEHCVL